MPGWLDLQKGVEYWGSIHYTASRVQAKVDIVSLYSLIILITILEIRHAYAHACSNSHTHSHTETLVG